MCKLGTFPDLFLKKYSISQDFHESKSLWTVKKLNRIMAILYALWVCWVRDSQEESQLCGSWVDTVTFQKVLKLSLFFLSKPKI